MASSFPTAVDNIGIPAAGDFLITPDMIRGLFERVRDAAQAAQGEIPVRAAGVFNNANWRRGLDDPRYARCLFERFAPFNKAAEAWILTQATSGTGVPNALAGSGARLDAGAVIDGQGPQIQLAGGGWIPAAGKDLWFETKVKDSFITGDFFFGLAEIDTTIIATSDMTTANHIGFSCFTGDGILLADCAKASTRVHTQAMNTLVADAYVTLGFRVNGVTDVTFYVNDVVVGTAILTANIPIVSLTPSIVVHATGTNRDVVDVAYIRAMQLA